MKMHLSHCEGYKNEFGEFYILEPGAAQNGNGRHILTAELKVKIDEAWAKAIIYGSWPFSIFEFNPFATEALDLMIPGYRPPNRHSIANEHLTKQYDIVVAEVKKVVDDSGYVSVCTDGWSNCRNEGMTNVVITTPLQFLHSVVPNGEEQSTGVNLAKNVSKSINSIGCSKVAGIITDNAANMRTMCTALKSEFPLLISAPCSAHSFNLLFQDVMKIDMFKSQWIVVIFKLINF